MRIRFEKTKDFVIFISSCECALRSVVYQTSCDDVVNAMGIGI